MLGIPAMILTLRLYQRWPWNRLFKFEDTLLIQAKVGRQDASLIRSRLTLKTNLFHR